MPLANITAADLCWKTNPPTDTTCSFLFGGHEHYFVLVKSFRTFARKTHALPVVAKAGRDWIPKKQYDQMCEIAAWVMQATPEQRHWVQYDAQRSNLRPLEEYKKVRQLMLL